MQSDRKQRLETFVRSLVRDEMLRQQSPWEGVPDVPSALDSERVVLGAMILGEPAPESVREDDFHVGSHRIIFAALKELGKTDLILLADHLRRPAEGTNRTVLDQIGGPAYLASLTEGIPRGVVLGPHAAILRRKRRLREIMAVCLQATSDCRNGEDPEAILLSILVGCREAGAQ